MQVDFRNLFSFSLSLYQDSVHVSYLHLRIARCPGLADAAPTDKKRWCCLRGTGVRMTSDQIRRRCGNPYLILLRIEIWIVYRETFWEKDRTWFASIVDMSCVGATMTM